MAEEQLLVLEKERLNRVSSILVSQPNPTDPSSPYYKLAEKYNLKIDFRPFIRIEPVDVKDFRRQKVNIKEFTAIIMTSRNAVDNFFRLAAEMKVEIPADLKYFCVSEQTANYLQKYIIIRKRKIFVGEKTAEDLIQIIKKHKEENFLYPCSSVRKEDIPLFLKENNFKFKEAVMYQTLASDLSDLSDIKYDIIAFFSPSGIESLFTNFPDFVQEKTRIAVFGPTTARAAIDAGLITDIQAPLPNAPSMTGALELYIREANGL
jgi:uroporphyrinogen-III synthase